MPAVTPVVDIEPTAMALLLHVPPAGDAFNVVQEPTHIPIVPAMAPGLATTVITVVATQPVEFV